MEINNKRLLYKFFSTMKVLYISIMSVFMVTLLIFGLYANYIDIRDWLGLADLSFPEIGDIADILLRLLLVVVGVSIIRILFFKQVHALFSRIKFKDHYNYDKTTFIAHERDLDYQAINTGFNYLWRAFLIGGGALLVALLVDTIFSFALSMIGVALFTMGFFKIWRGSRPGSLRLTYYPQSSEFTEIVMENNFGTTDDETSKQELIKKIDNLSDGCPDMPIAALLRKKILGMEVSMPFHSYGFGEPDREALRAEIEAFSKHTDSAIRRG